MKLKKIICAVITGAMLYASAYVPTYAYNREYCDPFNENSDTLVTDDMEVFYEKEGDINSLLYTVREDGTAMITGWAGKFYGDGTEFELDIPSTIDGHTVTAIADEALSDGSARIVGVSVPPTVKVIGVHAIDARYLKYLNLSEGLEIIKTAGINCGDNLTSIKISDSVKYMGGGAIAGEALTDIKLPSDLKYLGENITSATAYSADEGNRDGDILYNGQYLLMGYNYAYISVDDGSSDPSAQTQTEFTYLWGPTENAVIREGTTMMCEESFNFSTIKTVSIPSTLKEIPYLGFYSCKNLDNIVIPGNVKTIGDCAFSLNESLSNLTISEGVEKIGEMAFFGCNSLNEVTIPRSVTEIGMQAFGWDYVNDHDVRNENLVIKCYSGTAAQQYAKYNVFKCILLDTGETIEKGEPTAAVDSRAVCEEKGENCVVRKFKDLQDAVSDENHYGIEYCLDNGIMYGTGDDTFSPDDTITRGQFATMFYRLTGSPEASETSKFTDLTQDWYKKAVSWAAANGIVAGTSDRTFSPDATVTREQIATIFYRYAESLGLDMTISEGWDLSGVSYSASDTPISDYAIKPMSWCFDRGIIQRYVDENNGWEILYAPQHAPSRADTALMFRNFAYALEMN